MTKLLAMLFIIFCSLLTVSVGGAYFLYVMPKHVSTGLFYIFHSFLLLFISYRLVQHILSDSKRNK